MYTYRCKTQSNKCNNCLRSSCLPHLSKCSIKCNLISIHFFFLCFLSFFCVLFMCRTTSTGSIYTCIYVYIYSYTNAFHSFLSICMEKVKCYRYKVRKGKEKERKVLFYDGLSQQVYSDRFNDKKESVLTFIVRYDYLH